LKRGLVKEEKLGRWPFRKVLNLTEKGKEYVKMIKSQDVLLSPISKPSKERCKWILALLYKTGEGKIKGRLRLDKLIFLLKHEYGVGIPYKFASYIHGPYSADIFRDLAILKDNGFIDIRGENDELKEIIENKGSTSFVLTEKGEKEAKEFYEKLPAKARGSLIALRHFNRMSLRELVKHVYTNYPDFRL
jgi:uncharacterized protein YwgA